MSGPAANTRSRPIAMMPIVIAGDGSPGDRSDWRSGLCGIAVSVLVHLTGLALAAMICFSQPSTMFVAVMDSGWAEPGATQFDVQMPSDPERGAGDVKVEDLSLRQSNPFGADRTRQYRFDERSGPADPE